MRIPSTRTFKESIWITSPLLNFRHEQAQILPFPVPLRLLDDADGRVEFFCRWRENADDDNSEAFSQRRRQPEFQTVEHRSRRHLRS